MKISKYLMFLPVIFIFSCAGIVEKTKPEKAGEEQRFFAALTYYSFSEFERQEGALENAFTLLNQAYRNYPESIFLKEKMLLYLSANAMRDSSTAAYALKLGKKWYEENSYNSRIMFLLGEISLYYKHQEEAEKYLKASLDEDAEKKYYFTYYMFKKLYSPPADSLHLQKAGEEPWQDDDRELIYRIADILTEQNNIEKAENLLYKAYKRWGEMHILMNLVALDQKKNALSKPVEELLLELMRKDILPQQLLEYLISEYYSKEQYHKIIAMEKQCRSIGNEFVLKILYLSALEKQEFDLALEIGNLILLLGEISPSQKFAILGKLWELELMNTNWDKAIEYLKEIEDIKQKFIVLNLFMKETGEIEAVLSFLEFYFQNTDNRDESLFLVFLLNREAGRTERIPQLLSLLDPKFIVDNKLTTMLALPFLELDNEQKEEDINEVYQPFVEQDLILAGLFFFYLGKEEKSINYLSQAFQQEKFNLELFLIYGNILQARKENEKLKLVLKTGLKIYPEEAQLLNFFGYMAAELEWDADYNDADSALIKALDMEPENAMYWDSLGWLYYRMGKYEEALDAMRKTENEANQNGEIALHYGIILASNGMIEKAEMFLQLVSEISDDETLVKEAVKHLTQINKTIQEE